MPGSCGSISMTAVAPVPMSTAWRFPAWRARQVPHSQFERCGGLVCVYAVDFFASLKPVRMYRSASDKYRASSPRTRSAGARSHWLDVAACAAQRPTPGVLAILPGQAGR
jgi:hypothetical protein